MNKEKVHQGHNVRRFREMLRMKQEALALELGGDWTQKRVSLLEQKAEIDAEVLKEISAALKIPVEAIQNMDEDAAISIISNTFTSTSNDTSTMNVLNPYCTFNTFDKVVELYERLVEAEREKVALLEKVLEKGK